MLQKNRFKTKMSQSNIPLSKFLKSLSVWKETAVYFGLSKRWRGTEKSKHVEVLPGNPVQALIHSFFFQKNRALLFTILVLVKVPKMIVQSDAQSLTKVIISKMNLQRIMQTLGGAAVGQKCLFFTFRFFIFYIPVRCTLGGLCFCPLQTVPSFSGPEMQKPLHVSPVAVPLCSQ